MMRDPLDELIEDLEGIVPATPAKRTGIPWDFWEMSDRLDRESALARAQQHPRADVSASTIATVPKVWPAPPTRRLDPSAPTWDDSAQTNSDDTEN